MDTIRLATGHSIRVICAVLEVPRSSYYYAAKPTPTQRSDKEMGALIETIFREHRRRYGYRRISEELTAMDLTCAPGRVRRLMRERELKALQPRRFMPKTSDGRADRPSLNLLLDQPFPATPNAVWAGDITYIPTGKGWLYLAVVIPRRPPQSLPRRRCPPSGPWLPSRPPRPHLPQRPRQPIRQPRIPAPP